VPEDRTAQIAPGAGAWSLGRVKGETGAKLYYNNRVAKTPANETIDGKPVTDEQIREWADDAEKGFDVEDLRRRGRPRLGDSPSTVIPVRMDEDLLEALNEKAEHDGITRSEAIREAVRSWTRIA